MTRAVLWAGGWAHPGLDLIAAVEQLTARPDISLTTITDPDHAISSIEDGCDLLIVGACWFSMTDARYDDDQRAAHAVNLGTELNDALQNLRSNGCNLLALHTAPICFDGAEVWRTWLGGTWNWDTSWHPAPEPITVEPADATAWFTEFTVVDELYQGLDIDPSVKLVAQSAGGDPLVWMHETSNSRAAVNLLGHDRRSLQEPAHQRLNQQLLNWLLTD